MTYLRKPRRWTAALLGGLLGCADPTTPASPSTTDAAIGVTANLAAASAIVETVTLTVTAADLPRPIIVNLPLSGGSAAGSVTVPVGSARTFTLRAFDADGATAYEGATTADVMVGKNPALKITMRSTGAHGDVPIEATIGSYLITVTPASIGGTIGSPGDTLAFTVQVTDLSGGSVSPDILSVASSNPAVAQVVPGSITGTDFRVAALVPGAASLYVAFEGFASQTEIVVAVRPVASVTLEWADGTAVADGDTVVVGVGKALRAMARDADGNPVADAPVSWSISDPALAALSVSAAARVAVRPSR